MGPLFDRRALGKLGLASFASLFGAARTARSEDAPVLRLIEKVAFTSDGTRFFAADSSGGLTLRDAKTGKILREYELPSDVAKVSFASSPDGFSLASSHPRGVAYPKAAIPPKLLNPDFRPGAIDVREVDSGRLVYQLTDVDEPCPQVAIGQKYVMTLGRTLMRVWGCGEGKELYKVSLAPLVYPGAPWPIIELGGRISFAYPPRRPDCGIDRPESPFTALAPDAQRAMTHVIMRIPKGNTSILGSVIQCWDGTDRTFHRHVLNAQLYQLAIRPDGREFASLLAKGPADKYYKEGAIRQVEIQIRKFDDGSIVKTIPFRGPLPYFIAYDLDGKRLITATRLGGVSICDIDKGMLIRRFQGPNKAVRAVFLLPKGIRVVSGWHETDPKLDAAREEELRKSDDYQPLEIWER